MERLSDKPLRKTLDSQPPGQGSIALALVAGYLTRYQPNTTGVDWSRSIGRVPASPRAYGCTMVMVTGVVSP